MMTEFATVQPTDQILTFLYAILFGSGLCFLYDLLRGWRKVARTTTFALFWQDLFYCITAAFLVFCFLLVRCNGQLRIYALIGLAAGFWIFRATASGWILLGSSVFYRFLQKWGNKLLCPLLQFTKKTLVFCKNISKRKQKPLENPSKVDV